MGDSSSLIPPAASETRAFPLPQLGFIWITSGQASLNPGEAETRSHNTTHAVTTQGSAAQNYGKKNKWWKLEQIQNLSTKHLTFNEKGLFRQNSLSSKTCLTESRQQSCCVFHHLRYSPSGKCICWDKGIILMCWYFITKTYVENFPSKLLNQTGLLIK